MGLRSILFRIIMFVFGSTLMSSCETDHTSRKLVMNQSDYPLRLTYNNYCCDSDSVLLVNPQESIYIQYFTKRGSRPADGPVIPCAIQEYDTINVSLDSAFTFTGNFRDELRWHSQFEPGRSSVQTCTFTIVNEDFSS